MTATRTHNMIAMDGCANTHATYQLSHASHITMAALSPALPMHTQYGSPIVQQWRTFVSIIRGGGERTEQLIHLITINMLANASTLAATRSCRDGTSHNRLCLAVERETHTASSCGKHPSTEMIQNPLALASGVSRPRPF